MIVMRDVVEKLKIGNVRDAVLILKVLEKML